MIRRISTKLVLAVLAAVVLPFVAFAFYIDHQMGARLTRNVVQQALLGLAKSLAGELDTFVSERREDLELWADTPFTREALTEYATEQDLLPQGIPNRIRRWDADVLARWAREGETMEDYERDLWRDRAQLTGELDRYLGLRRMVDVLLLVSADGRLVTCTTRDGDGELFEPSYLEGLFAADYSGEPWFQAAARGENHAVDQHLSPFAPPAVVGAADVAHRHELGFAAPVHDELQPSQVNGVLYALVNWSYVQHIVSTDKVRNFFRGLVREEPSPYAWVWADDADTILAHHNPALYGRLVSRDVALPELTQAVLDDADGEGLYPEYSFEGERKNAAFKLCRGVHEGGFGWVVGVGIDNDDIYATADELRQILLGGTALVLLLAVLCTLYIARRTTEPIQALQQTTRRVAEGDLDARIEVRSHDELGALAEDFNRMTHELKEGRERLVKAEKDAAWREMARQIAHDIKNPLTPVSLSLDLLERARREKAPGWEDILERTMGLVRRQVANLRQIAQDFYEFTGGTRPHPERVLVRELLSEVLHLHDAWAVEQGVEVHLEGPEAAVFVDRGKLRRVFVNLVTNALQAMPDGGELFAEVALEGSEARVAIRDTGLGLSGEAREHLFEPYFTTKGEGTGLGLAISKQMVEQMGGRIELGPSRGELAPSGSELAPSGGERGTTALVRLPLDARERDPAPVGAP
jgi:signal transduction histidine kinase